LEPTLGLSSRRRKASAGDGQDAALDAAFKLDAALEAALKIVAVPAAVLKVEAAFDGARAGRS
jgi:hypothetical protein